MTNDLPPEILCEVFLLVSQDMGQAELKERTRVYQGLSLVSHFWKATLEAERQLWTDCTLRYEPDLSNHLSSFDPPPPRTGNPNEQRQQELGALERYYQRARNLPLSIRIELDSYDREFHGDLKPLALFIISWGER